MDVTRAILDNVVQLARLPMGNASFCEHLSDLSNKISLRMMGSSNESEILPIPVIATRLVLAHQIFLSALMLSTADSTLVEKNVIVTARHHRAALIQRLMLAVARTPCKGRASAMSYLRAELFALLDIGERLRNTSALVAFDSILWGKSFSCLTLQENTLTSCFKEDTLNALRALVGAAECIVSGSDAQSAIASLRPVECGVRLRLGTCKEKKYDSAYDVSVNDQIDRPSLVEGSHRSPSPVPDETQAARACLDAEILASGSSQAERSSSQNTAHKNSLGEESHGEAAIASRRLALLPAVQFAVSRARRVHVEVHRVEVELDALLSGEHYRDPFETNMYSLRHAIADQYAQSLPFPADPDVWVLPAAGSDDYVPPNWSTFDLCSAELDEVRSRFWYSSRSSSANLIVDSREVFNSAVDILCSALSSVINEPLVAVDYAVVVCEECAVALSLPQPFTHAYQPLPFAVQQHVVQHGHSVQHRESVRCSTKVDEQQTVLRREMKDALRGLARSREGLLQPLAPNTAGTLLAAGPAAGASGDAISSAYVGNIVVQLNGISAILPAGYSWAFDTPSHLKNPLDSRSILPAGEFNRAIYGLIGKCVPGCIQDDEMRLRQDDNITASTWALFGSAAEVLVDAVSEFDSVATVLYNGEPATPWATHDSALTVGFFSPYAGVYGDLTAVSTKPPTPPLSRDDHVNARDVVSLCLWLCEESKRLSMRLGTLAEGLEKIKFCQPRQSLFKAEYLAELNGQTVDVGSTVRTVSFFGAENLLEERVDGETQLAEGEYCVTTEEAIDKKSAVCNLTRCLEKVAEMCLRAAQLVGKGIYDTKTVLSPTSDHATGDSAVLSTAAAILDYANVVISAIRFTILRHPLLGLPPLYWIPSSGSTVPAHSATSGLESTIHVAPPSTFRLCKS